jgi:hypothetical protein
MSHLGGVIAFGDKCEARDLPELAGVAQHSHIHELYEITLGVLDAFRTQNGTYICRLFLDDRALLGCSLCAADLGNQGAAHGRVFRVEQD